MQLEVFLLERSCYTEPCCRSVAQQTGWYQQSEWNIKDLVVQEEPWRLTEENTKHKPSTKNRTAKAHRKELITSLIAT